MQAPVYDMESHVYILDSWAPVVRGIIASYILPLPQGRAAIVDSGPATSANRVREALESLGLELSAVLVTHVHLDHAGATGILLKLYPDAVAYVHPRGKPHLVDPTRLWESSKQVMGDVAEVYGKPEPAPEDRVVATSDGERIILPGGREILVLHTPGHASHHQSFYEEATRTLYTGDSAGIILETTAGIVRAPTTPPRLKPHLYLESLERMMRLGAKSIAPTHFGLWPNAGEELRLQRDIFTRWMNELLEIHRMGVRSPPEAAKRLALRDPNAATILRVGGPVRDFFLYETVWGMLDAIERGEWP